MLSVESRALAAYKAPKVRMRIARHAAKQVPGKESHREQVPQGRLTQNSSLSLVFHIVVFMIGNCYGLADEFKSAAVPVIALADKAPRTARGHRCLGIVQLDNKVAVFSVNIV